MTVDAFVGFLAPYKGDPNFDDHADDAWSRLPLACQQIAAVESALVASVHTGTSITSLTVGTGSKTLTTQAGKAWTVGTWLSITSTLDPTDWLYGRVTAYNSATGALTVSVTEAGGSGTANSWSIALQTVGGTTPSAGRNLVTNGDMRIDQRNSGVAQTITAGAALAYTMDRWYAYCTGANVVGQRVAGTAPEPYVYRITGAAGCTGIGFGQRIEAADCAHLAGSTAMLSVTLANGALTTVTWTAYYATTADTFGTLASPTRTQIATGTFTVSATQTRYQVPITIPAAATTGIEVVFSVGAQTSGTWAVGAVQLEAGGVATVFERRPIAHELTRCQRYYETGFTRLDFLPAVNLQWQSVAQMFQTRKRAAPTMTKTVDVVGVNVNALNVAYGSAFAEAFTPAVQAAFSGTQAQGAFGWSASAEL